MEINEQQQKMEEGSVDDDKILCIEVYSQGKGSLFPVEKVETVAASPVIVNLPESKEEVIGIGRYGKYVVPYYQLSGRDCIDKRAADVRCGVILRAAKGCIGIAADEVSEEKLVRASEYEDQIPEHLRWVLGGKEV